jgi:hypothetical protein
MAFLCPALQRFQAIAGESAFRQKYTRLLCSFYSGRADREQPDSAKCVPADAQRTFLIATVPDPARTPMASSFDVAVDSIIRAAGDAGFRYDRFWLPWPQPTAGSRSKTGEAKPATTSYAEKDTGEHEPGVLLFRGEDPEDIDQYPPLLIVFLVGETPTSGVHKTSFWEAAMIASEEPGREVRVLGPGFSGSVPSLRLVVSELRRERQDQHLPFRLVTGTATRAGNQQDFKADEIAYSATVENDAVTERLLRDWLVRQGIPGERIAVLQESATAFGASLGSTSPLTVEFPYQIAYLRNSYQEDNELRQLLQATRDQAQRERLQSDFRSQTEATDRVASYAGAQTSQSQEMVILSIAKILRDHRVQAAGINASDTLDTVFIAHLLHRWAPDVRLFTLDSDILFLRSTPGVSFHGLLMAANYPLFLDHQIWRSDQFRVARHIKPFVNRSAQGIYNASLVLLKRIPNTEISGYPHYLMQLARLAEYSDPLRASTAPPLWLTVVGREQVWPVAILTDGEGSSLHQARQEPVFADTVLRPSRWFWMLVLAMGCLGTVKVFKYGLNWTSPCVSASVRRTSDMLGVPEGFMLPWLFRLPLQHSFGASVFVQMVAGFAIAGGAPVLMILIRFLPNAGGPWLSFSAVILAVWYLLLLAAGVVVLWHERRQCHREVLGSGLGALYPMLSRVGLAGLVLYCGVWACALFDVRGLAASQSLFLLLRSLHPFSGVSPLVAATAFCLGAGWWAVTQLNRMHLEETRSPGFDGGTGCSSPPFASLLPVRELQEATRPTHWYAWEFSVILIMLGVVALSTRSPLTSLEGFPISSALSVGLLFVAILAVITLARLLLIWSRLKRLLQGIQWTPLVEPVTRLARQQSVSQLWSRGTEHLHLQVLRRSVESLAPVEVLLSDDQRKTAARVNELWDQVVRKGGQLSACVGELRELHGGLNSIADDLVKQLDGDGAVDPSSILQLAASRVGMFLRYVVAHIRALLEFLSLSVFLLLLAILSYPFEPRGNLVWGVTILFLAASATGLGLLVQLDRSPLLSAPKDDKGKWNVSLVLRIASYGAAPVLALLANQYPQLARQLLSWVEPLLGMLRG